MPFCDDIANSPPHMIQSPTPHRTNRFLSLSSATSGKTSLMAKCGFAATIFLLSPIAAPAADILWTGAGAGGNSQNWGRAAAWTGSVIPGVNDNAIFQGISVWTNQGQGNYQPVMESANGNTGAQYSVGGVHFNNTPAVSLTVPTAGGLTVLNTTLVSQSTSMVVQGAGFFTTNNLSVASGANLTLTSGTVSGRLSGLGGVLGSVTVSGTGTHTPGGSSTLAGVYTAGVGTQAVGNITYSSGSSFVWDLASATSYDRVTGIGTLGGSGARFTIASAIGFGDSFWSVNRQWTDVFSGFTSGNISSVFSSITGSGITWNSGNGRGEVGIGGSRGYFTLSGSNLNWTAVPEVSNVLVSVVLAAGLLRRRRQGSGRSAAL